MPSAIARLDRPARSLLLVLGAAALALLGVRDQMSESPLGATVAGFLLVAVCAWVAGHATGTTTPSPIVRQLEAALAREHALARTDQLTGLSNGRAFRERMAIEAERASRSGAPLAVAYIDIDHFKRVNDRQGHAAGDAVLRRIGAALQAQSRDTDLVARIGGDEFAILLPDTDADAAAYALEDLRRHLEAEFADDGWAVTASIGAAVFGRGGGTPDGMLHHADGLMYAAKRRGRNRLEVAQVYTAA